MKICDADADHTHASRDKVGDTISLNEIRTFIKDMRCSTRVTIKLAQIYHTTLNSASMFEDGRRVDGGAEESQGEFDDEDQELGPAKFVEFVIHLSQEQIPGKDNIARKVQMMLNTMSRHCKAISGPIPQVSSVFVCVCARVCGRGVGKLVQVVACTCRG